MKVHKRHTKRRKIADKNRKKINKKTQKKFSKRRQRGGENEDFSSWCITNPTAEICKFKDYTVKLSVDDMEKYHNKYSTFLEELLKNPDIPYPKSDIDSIVNEISELLSNIAADLDYYGAVKRFYETTDQKDLEKLNENLNEYYIKFLRLLQQTIIKYNKEIEKIYNSAKPPPPLETPAHILPPIPPARSSLKIVKKPSDVEKIQNTLLKKLPKMTYMPISKEDKIFICTLKGEEFIKEKELGEGAFGTVFLIKSKETKKQLAMKQLNLSKQLNKYKEKYKKISVDELLEKVVEKTINEINILKSIKTNCDEYFHLCYDDIYYNVDDDSFLLYITMEYLQDGSDLLQFIKDNESLPDEDNINIIDQIVQSVEKLHEIGIAHRDLKPENIYVYKKDGKYKIKLLDFGLSCFLDNIPNGYCGTRLYSDPEIIVGHCFTKSQVKIADLWSIAIIVIFIFDIDLYAFVMNHIDKFLREPNKKENIYGILNVIFKNKLKSEHFDNFKEYEKFISYKDCERYNKFIINSIESGKKTIDIRNLLDDKRTYKKILNNETVEEDAEKVEGRGGSGSKKSLCVEPLGYETSDGKIYDSLDAVPLDKTVRAI